LLLLLASFYILTQLQGRHALFLRAGHYDEKKPCACGGRLCREIQAMRKFLPFAGGRRLYLLSHTTIMITFHPRTNPPFCLAHHDRGQTHTHRHEKTGRFILLGITPLSFGPIELSFLHADWTKWVEVLVKTIPFGFFGGVRRLAIIMRMHCPQTFYRRPNAISFVLHPRLPLPPCFEGGWSFYSPTLPARHMQQSSNVGLPCSGLHTHLGLCPRYPLSLTHTTPLQHRVYAHSRPPLQR
jgi:hypothetical protein